MGVLQITVQVTSANAGLAAITDMVGLQPTYGFDMGEPISRRNPKSGVRVHARWCLVFPDVDETGYDAVVAALDAVASVREDDWEVSIALKIDANTERSTWVNVPSEVIGSLSRVEGLMSVDAFALEA